MLNADKVKDISVVKGRKIHDTLDQFLFCNGIDREWCIESIEKIKTDYLLMVRIGDREFFSRFWVTGDLRECIWLKAPADKLVSKIVAGSTREKFLSEEVLVLWRFGIKAYSDLISTDGISLYSRKKIASRTRDGFNLISSDRRREEFCKPEGDIKVSFGALLALESKPEDLIVLDLKGQEALFRDVETGKTIFKGYDQTITTPFSREFVLEVDASSIDEAIEKIKPEEVIEAEFSGKKIRRQGDMFFIPRDSNSLKAYPQHFIPSTHPKGYSYYSLQAYFAPYDNPDLNLDEGKIKGSEVLDFMGRHIPSYFNVIDGQVLVRGEIVHPEHDTVFLDSWHRVVKSSFSGVHPEDSSEKIRLD